MKKNILVSLGITLVIGFIYFYIALPPLNPTSMQFWAFVIALVVIFSMFYSIQKVQYIFSRRRIQLDKLPMILVCGVGLVLVGVFVTNFILSPLFQSGKYADRIEIQEDGNFAEDVLPVDFSKLPLLDKASSQKLGDRVMGQMPELVSQFLVSDMYTQINYNDQIMRVTPLEYNGIIKYFTNKKNGVAGYITVNSVDGTSNLVKLEKGMKYVPSAMFSYDLMRHIRFQYPTAIFDDAYFEIDNDGHPYWIVPTVCYHGVGIRREINGVIIVDPITGKSKKYKVSDVPTWVDHVYSPELVIEQVNDWGKYKNGFINSLFGQKNVVATTEGYNYTVMNDDVYLYTGITSVSSDEANIGFILANLRTKETVFYSIPGAEEYSAMASAEGQVQQMNYTSTFPLLINLNGNPTYLVSLKDHAGLVKMYGFVDVVDYQKVSVSDAALGIERAASEYLAVRGNNASGDGVLVWKNIQVAFLQDVMIDGTTYYYLTDTDGMRYRVSVKVDKYRLPFVTVGSTLEVGYLDGQVSENNVIEIEQVK